MTITFHLGYWMAPVAWVFFGTLYLIYVSIRDNADQAVICLVLGMTMICLMLLTRFLP